MPIQDDDRHDAYAYDVEIHKEALQTIVDGSKLYVELAGLFSLFAATATVFLLLVNRLFHSGPELRLICGIAVTFVIAMILIGPATRAAELGAETAMLATRRFFRIPYGFEHRHMVFKAFWRAFVATICTAAVWGIVLMFVEIAKTGISAK